VFKLSIKEIIFGSLFETINYTFYTGRYAIFFLIYEFTIFEVIELIRMRDRINELTEGLFLASTYITLCLKYANFLLRKNDVSEVLDCLRVKMCQPRNSTEKIIIETHSRKGIEFIIKGNLYNSKVFLI